ncbi:MAG: ribulose-phosphate 3-epimerase [Nanoarchaeota archaeon]|nr:ribulose-phosphate 3-epimerase [Nanoarchaeota archaeon]
MRQITPSLIAKTQKELEKRFDRIKDYSKVFHLDIMDGKFVKNKSLFFDFILPKKRFKYEAHLMVKNPELWVKKNWKKSDLIIFHIESLKNESEVKNLIKLIKSKRKKVGICINPKTKIKKIINHLNLIDMVLVMTVIPGKYGGKFLPDTLKKVKDIKKLKPKLNIEIDGSVNLNTINRASDSGASSFVVGSFLQKSKNPKKAIEDLKRKK